MKKRVGIILDSTRVSRITTLTPNNYVEESLCEIEPHFFKDIKGTHTYNFQSGLMVLDYVKVSKKSTGI